MNFSLKKYTLLISDDDPFALKHLGQAMSFYFGEVILTDNGRDAFQKCKEHDVHIILTDIVMPEYDGINFLHCLRNEKLSIPVVCMSACSEKDILLKAIRLRVRDYLLKPLNIEHVIITLQKILAEKYYHEISIQDDQNFTLINGITVNLSQKTVMNKEQLIELTQKEFEMLEYLLINRKAILTRNDIETALWSDFSSGPSRVKTLMKKLRAKIGDECIMTVKNLGYKIHTQAQK